jgi:two-component system, LuxR family, response regulator FixJ
MMPAKDRLVSEPIVYLADDEPAVLRSVGFMLRTSGYRVECFASGEDLLRNIGALGSGTILLDVRMPGMDGLQVLDALHERGVTLPVIIITGHGDIAIAVRAMKAGALDFIEKPFEKSVLLAALQQAETRLATANQMGNHADSARVLLNALTPRERDVLRGLVDGHSNKAIAYDLGISPRTVEIHRANLMAKLAAKSLSDALRIAFTARLERDDV